MMSNNVNLNLKSITAKMQPQSQNTVAFNGILLKRHSPDSVSFQSKNETPKENPSKAKDNEPNLFQKLFKPLTNLFNAHKEAKEVKKA